MRSVKDGIDFDVFAAQLSEVFRALAASTTPSDDADNVTETESAGAIPEARIVDGKLKRLVRLPKGV